MRNAAALEPMTSGPRAPEQNLQTPRTCPLVVDY